MHREILTKEQYALLPLVKKFRKNFGLVGGTAIALHIGHRESIDFDMFSPEEFSNANIRRVFASAGKKIKSIRALTGQFTFIVDEVHLTFFRFPYPIEYTESFEDVLRMPTLITLAAMKAFALGQRSKWKDYVDMYFILRGFHSIEEISKKGEELFEDEFNAKLFRQQLSYFEDINYSEEVTYKEGFEVSNEEVRHALIEYSIS